MGLLGVPGVPKESMELLGVPGVPRYAKSSNRPTNQTRDYQRSAGWGQQPPGVIGGKNNKDSLGKRLLPAQSKPINGNPAGEVPQIWSADRVNIQSRGVGERLGELIKVPFCLPQAVVGITPQAPRSMVCRRLTPHQNCPDKGRLSGPRSQET